MVNFYDYVSGNDCFRKFMSDDIMLASYRCMLDQSQIPVWTHHNCFLYVLTGSDKWFSDGKSYFLQAGDVGFIRRGAYLAQRCSEEEFNAVVLFVSDAFIHSILGKHRANTSLLPLPPGTTTQTVFVQPTDKLLSAYFTSLHAYFQFGHNPSPELLRIKCEELLLLLLSGGINPELARHLSTGYQSGKVSIPQVMESSFMFNMSLEEYARLCARSLSSFKADFHEVYHTTPGKWLIARRLQYARFLIETTDQSVNDIAFNSGFKNTTHFVRIFKENYGMPPMKYRMQNRIKAA